MPRQTEIEQKEMKQFERRNLVGRTCRGICQIHKADAVPNKIRYDIGQKRCTFCGIFLDIEDTRCICCKAVLRTRARSKKD
jgi:hypothetical protein